jgi:DNA polymerase III alpha subunit
MMRHALTAKHEYMKFLCLEDRHGVVEVVIFPDVYRRYGRETDSAGAYRIEGKVEEQHGAVNLVAERVHRLAHPSSSSWSHLAAK